MKRLHIRTTYKVSKVLLVIFLLIFFLTFFLLRIYDTKISPKIMTVAEARLKKFTESFLSNNVGYDLFTNDALKDILVINKNEAGEIIFADFDLNKAYMVLDTVTDELNRLITDMENGVVVEKIDSSISSSANGLVMAMPMMVASDSVLLSNLGPKIYFKINFVGSLLTNIRSEIREYGMNNALVELYVTIKVTEQIVAPVAKSNLEIEYDVLISSQVINGRVPAYYGGAIIEKSNLLSIPIE